MKTLALFRHAKSDWADPRARDFERPLNKRGEKGALTMGRWIRDHRWRFDRNPNVYPGRVRRSPAIGESSEHQPEFRDGGGGTCADRTDRQLP